MVATSCQPAPPAEPAFTDADVTAIRAQIDRYVQAALAGDWNAWGLTLAEDVVVMPPNGAPITGRAAATAFIQGFGRLSSFTVNVDEVSGAGDLAYTRGTFAFSATLPDSTSLTDSGSFLEIHARGDGSWPYTHLIWHSDLPVAPPPPAPSR
jgi:ketosteroid isomerase-like protein